MQENLFAARLALAMKLKSVNQSDVSRALGVSQTTISRWLGGAMPRISIAGAIAEFLDCRIEWLLEGKGEAPGRFSVFESKSAAEVERISALPESEQGKELEVIRNKAKELFPFRLRKLRETSGLGINEFAKKIGCAPSYISRLEAGSRANPSARFLDKLAAYFGVNRLWLLYGWPPVVHVPAKDFPSFVKTIDLNAVEALGKIDSQEKQLSQDELTHILDLMAKEMPAEKFAQVIEACRNANWGIGSGAVGDFTDLMKDVLVRKIAGGKAKK